MLGSQQIISFVATSDPAQAKSFYRDMLGLNLVSEDPYALVFDAAGTMLRIAVVEKVVPVPYTVLGWQVDDLPTVAAELSAAGIVPERFSGLKQDDSGVWTSPGGARILWFKDPDENLLSLTQF